MPKVDSLDHLVLTVSDVETLVGFYRAILGMEAQQFFPADGSERWALKFGKNKINLHQKGEEFAPFANSPAPGSADLCFLSDTPISDWLQHLSEHKIAVEDGPVTRTGATGPITSIYIRDPDRNLIEISNKA